MSRYSSGANLERALVNHLRGLGWVAARSAGSKSPVDVWAAKDGVVIAYQCAVNYTHAKELAVKAASEKMGIPVLLITRKSLRLMTGDRSE